MNTSLAQYQDRFAQGLLAPSEWTSDNPSLNALMQQPGFGVYRNTVMKGLIDALQANFPAVVRLVGEEFFRAVAKLYAEKYPAADARLLQYGEHFPAFLQNFEPAQPWPYLGPVAQLDRCWLEAHIAADAPAITAEQLTQLTQLTPEALAHMVLRPHPAARWIWFADQPVFTLWQRSRSALNEADDIEWIGEGALLTRIHGNVQWIALDKAGCDLLTLCTSGQPITQNLQQLQLTHPHADFSGLMASLLQTGALMLDSPTAP